MNQEMVDKIAAAVLYEGYVLYPYRPSVKNHHRWTFGGIYPRQYSERQNGSDPWEMRTQCLINCGDEAKVQVKIRFLHLMMRSVEEAHGSGGFRPIQSLTVEGQQFHTWQEAVERDVALEEFGIDKLLIGSQTRRFSFAHASETSPLRDSDGKTAGRIVRRQQRIDGSIEIAAERKSPEVVLLTVRISNLTPLEDEEHKDPGAIQRNPRDVALMRALVSTHAILGVQNGAFISLTDPAAEFQEYVSSCVNVGCWPVLVGETGEADTMLSSPIILYDYPQVAPESPGDLFDGLEIDEILTLRILTLTDEEKRQAAAVDDRVRQLLSRTSALAGEQLLSLHGMVRGVPPV